MNIGDIITHIYEDFQIYISYNNQKNIFITNCFRFTNALTRLRHYQEKWGGSQARKNNPELIEWGKGSRGWRRVRRRIGSESDRFEEVSRVSSDTKFLKEGEESLISFLQVNAKETTDIIGIKHLKHKWHSTKLNNNKRKRTSLSI